MQGSEAEGEITQHNTPDWTQHTLSNVVALCHEPHQSVHYAEELIGQYMRTRPLHH